MKKYILLLTALAIVQYGATAQTHHPTKKAPVTHHKHHTVHHAHAKAATVHSKHNIKFSDNDARAPYEGKHSMANDGVKKNESRNLNYQNNSTVLPANNGSMPK
jgi:hypothetical protein